AAEQPDRRARSRRLRRPGPGARPRRNPPAWTATRPWAGRRLPAAEPGSRNPRSRPHAGQPRWKTPGRARSRREHGLAGANERPHDPASDLAGQHLGVEPAAGEERPRVLELVDAGGLD